MPRINFTVPDGSIQTVEANEGSSVMETGVRFGVPGIVAECGGALACATCHVYVDDEFLSAVGGPDDFEDEMLDDAESPRAGNSRLSCQIRMSPSLDGLSVTVAPEQ
ncbi:2Fe-2S iron-sulfur cluster-binding protein [Dietzia sp. PP-33]|uniref:2Fe-2S iron-sulfur cluster-binding protein n=1 Tax=Dietzia sp. PP-33 TaxID=2957500 RepID=UPI0029B7145D|nr:2Fe-2S iron-sulfur cluster-binding protein [Dietzia sp. PP-33]MDX2358989.1 (2Fe-2S)-binding protein [Dietzia sp. PP-33]